MDLKHNPLDKVDIDAERERREEILDELNEGITTSSIGDEEVFDSERRPELEALLPYYNQVEDQALRIAKKYFHGTFIADSRNIHNQRLFEYENHGHTYRCYVDIFNENEDEINIIEVKAITNSKLLFEVDKRGVKTGLYFTNVAKGKRNGTSFPLFKKDGNIWMLNTDDSKSTDDASKNYEQKKLSLLDSIKTTLPVLVPALTYKGMDVGNGVKAYITYLNYDSSEPTFGIMRTKLFKSYE